MSYFFILLLTFASLGALTAQDNCDCEIDYNEPFICAQDSAGAQQVVPNACVADCLGLTVVEDGCDDWGGGDWGGNCGCEIDPNEAFVCVQDENGEIFLAPNACIADCYGFTVVEDGCDDWGGGGDPWGDGGHWGHCDCEIDPNEPFVCVEDQDGFLMEVPNACFADCLGFTLLGDDCDDWGGSGPWSDCDCEIDLEEPFVCAQDSTGEQFLLPNACIADCLGFTVVEDGCDGDITFSGDEDSALGLCIASLDLEGTQLFQTFLLLLNSECGLPLDDCILDAPAFDNDDDFFTYLMDNCFADGDLQGDDSMLRLFNSYRGATGVTATSSTATASLANEVTLLQNPVTDVLRYRVTAASPDRITVRVVGISGQTLQETALDVQTGLNDYSLHLGNLPAGLYLLSVTGENSLTTLRFVRN